MSRSRNCIAFERRHRIAEHSPYENHKIRQTSPPNDRRRIINDAAKETTFLMVKTWVNDATLMRELAGAAEEISSKPIDDRALGLRNANFLT